MISVRLRRDRTRRVARRRRALAPTLFGARAALFYIVVVAAYFAAPYVNLFFLLLGFLSLHWVLALPWTFRNVARLELMGRDLELSQPAGSPGHFPLSLHQPGQSAIGVTVEVVLEGRSGALELATGHVDVVRGSRAVELSLPPLARGVWTVVGARVTSTHPFGLMRRSRVLPLAGEVVVHPVPTQLGERAERSAQELMHELTGSPASGDDVLQPSSLRDHRSGESLRLVSWKASARRGRLVVLEWEGGHGDGLEVVLDRRAPEGALESAFSDLAAVVLLAREGKERLRIRSQGHDRTYGDGHARWSGALRFLAEAEPLGPGAESPPAASPGVLRLPRPGAASTPETVGASHG